MSSLIKNLLIIVVVIAVVYFGYNFFFAGNDPALDLGIRSNEGDILNAEFISRLNELEEVNFSSSIFTDARFRSLESFSTVPEPASAGRSLPFSP